MSVQLVHIGFGNYVASNRIRARKASGSAPVQRLIRESRKDDTAAERKRRKAAPSQRSVIDLTSGRRTKTAALLDSGHIILLAIAPETLDGRISAAREGKD